MSETSPESSPVTLDTATPAAPTAPSPNISGSLSFDRVAHIYDETRGYPHQVAVEIAEALIAYGPFPPQSAIIEIGIGTGRIALPLLARGVNVTGVDISEQMVARLRAKYEAGSAAASSAAGSARGALRVELADMTALPFADATFAGAIAVHVLHLVPAWRRALDEVLRVIQPGGALLVGQDVTHGDALNLVIQDEWVQIIRRLGAEPMRPGAAGYDEILAEARARGFTVTERAVTTWTDTTTPRQALAALAQREWSRTWSVPDDLFAASLDELTRWVTARFAGALDTPQPGLRSFKVARVAMAAPTRADGS